MSLAANKFLFHNKYSLSALGRLALALMLVFTGSSHFIKTGEMVQMMPDFFPNKTAMVHSTGVLELLAAVGLMFRRTAKWVSIGLVVFLILVLPANVIGSMKRVELGGMEHGPGYLFFRLPLQMVFIWWTYYFGIRLLNKMPGRRSESYSHV